MPGGRPKGSKMVRNLPKEIPVNRSNPVVREKLVKAEATTAALLEKTAEKKAKQKLYREEYARRRREGLPLTTRNSLRTLPEFKGLSDEEFRQAKIERNRIQTNESARRNYYRKKAKARGEEYEDLRAAEYRPGYVDVQEYKELPDEKRAELRAAALASICLGQSAAQVAVQYNIPYAQVNSIVKAFESANSIQRRDWLSEALMVYIQQEIKSLMAISMVTSNEEWVMEQNAADLSMYIATKSDKLTQLLQSFGRVTNERDQYVEQLETVVQEM